MKVFLGLLFLIAGIACGWAIFLVEDTSIKLACVCGVFGAGVFYGLLTGSKR